MTHHCDDRCCEPPRRRASRRSPAARPVWASRSCASSSAAARAWPSSRGPRERVEAVARAHPGTHGIVGDVARKEDIHPIALQIVGNLGGLDVLVNNASSLGPTPLALLADTECEDFELALATNVLGPFRLTKALLGRADRVGARGPRQRRAQRVERCRDQRRIRSGARTARARPRCIT